MQGSDVSLSSVWIFYNCIITNCNFVSNTLALYFCWFLLQLPPLSSKLKSLGEWLLSQKWGVELLETLSEEVRNAVDVPAAHAYSAIVMYFLSFVDFLTHLPSIHEVYNVDLSGTVCITRQQYITKPMQCRSLGEIFTFMTDKILLSYRVISEVLFLFQKLHWFSTVLLSGLVYCTGIADTANTTVSVLCMTYWPNI